MEIVCRALSYHQASIHIAELQTALDCESAGRVLQQQSTANSSSKPSVKQSQGLLLVRQRCCDVRRCCSASYLKENDVKGDEEGSKTQLDPVSIEFCRFVDQSIALLQPPGGRADANKEQHSSGGQGDSKNGVTQEMMPWRTLRSYMMNYPLLNEFLIS